MNRMKTLIYENGITMIAQTNQGRNHKMKVTAAAHKLAERAKSTEANYASGKLSAADVLRLAACHYNDDAVLTLLRNAADHEAFLRNEEPDTDSPPNSQLSASQQESQDLSDNETEQDSDSDLEPMDAQNWSTTDWLHGIEQSNLDNNPASASRSSTPSRLPPDASDLVEPVCILCNDNPDMQEVMACAHFFCGPCINRPEFQRCPICRTPKSDTFKIRIKTVMLAYKRDIATSFGNPSGLQADHTMDGRRPGDTTLAQDLERMSEDLAASLQADNNGNKLHTMPEHYHSPHYTRSLIFSPPYNWFPRKITFLFLIKLQPASLKQTITHISRFPTCNFLAIFNNLPFLFKLRTIPLS